MSSAGAGTPPLPVRAAYVHGRFRHGHHDNDLVLLELSRPLSFGPALMHLCLPTRDFGENVLMHPGRAGVAGVAGGVERLAYLTLDECRAKLNVSHTLSNKMFCMQRQGGPPGPQPGPPGPQLGPPAHGHQDGIRGSPAVLAAHPRAAPGRQSPALAEKLNQTSGRGGPHGGKGGGAKEGGAKEGGCSALLPGTPVVTAEKGTAFLTGLMMSSQCDGEGGGGLVFTKLSRYLSWIKPRLQVAEDHMVPQVTQFPEEP